MRGSELLKQSRLDQAQRAFRTALEIEPDNARVLALLGLAHFRAGEFNDARAVYEQLVARTPTDASHRLNLGLVYLKLNDADQAIAALEASRALDPSQGRAVSYLGLAYARGGRYAEAYRAFLIAGQNDLATEIETNLSSAERDRIHSQLGRTPQGPLPPGDPGRAAVAAARVSTPNIPRTLTPTGVTAIPRTPTPTGVATIPRTPTPPNVAIPRTPTPPGATQPIAPVASATVPPAPPATAPPAPPSMSAATAASTLGPRTPTPTGGTPAMSAATAASALGARTPTPNRGTPATPTATIAPSGGGPRTRPPMAPPAKRMTRELPLVAPPEEPSETTPTNPAISIATPPPSSTTPPTSPSTMPPPTTTMPPPPTMPLPSPTTILPAAEAAPREGRVSDSTQFVMPTGDPAAPQRELDGPSMISRAVASAAPPALTGTRTRAGGIPPRPLSELATEELLRPDDGEDAFEISANGALIVRVTDRVMSRLDGVHVTGGDLGYEPAMRRSRGHNTEEAFDYRGSPLHAITGRGYLIAVPGAHAFAAVTLDDDILYLREDLVFAFQASLRWENGNVPGLRGRLPVVQFRGNGALAMRLARPLVRVKLPPQGMVFVDADRLAGWIGRVIPRAVVPPAGGPLGAMCVECTGEGVVLIEPMPEVAHATAAQPDTAANAARDAASGATDAPSDAGRDGAPVAETDVLTDVLADVLEHEHL